jgi:hypothetical protein
VVLLLSALSAIVAWPALAGALRQHLVVRDLPPSSLPAPLSVSRPQGPVAFEPPPKGRRWEPLDHLAHTIGAAPLVPAYLPAGCEERERFSYGPARVAYLTYTCVELAEEGNPVKSGTRGKTEPPAAAAGGPTEELAIGTQPALYWRGGWMDAESSNRNPLPGGTPAPTVEPGPRAGRRLPTLVWREDVGQTLIVERGAVLVTLRAPSVDVMPKEELIRIAESLQPVQLPE